jgi:hypothetical protein
MRCEKVKQISRTAMSLLLAVEFVDSYVTVNLNLRLGIFV